MPLVALCVPIVACAATPSPVVPVERAFSPQAPRAKPQEPVAGAAPEAVPRPPPAPWAWVLPVDHGIRADRGGGGAFLAPRAHGSHNGIDLLAPVGTPVLAPCAGKARAGQNSSHGKWVQVVCEVPAQLALPPARRVSLFFAHLHQITGLGDDPSEVSLGAEVGTVGKTGNASSSIVAAHLHLELSVHDDEAQALADHHSGRDQSDSASRCLEPQGLAQLGGQLWRARRADPFVILTCLGARKPAYSRPSGKLAEASFAWSTRYRAQTFDVDREGPPAVPERGRALQ
jgi:murein DD-endopeptidase MepM/ murein hydrolase activator NlpD